MKKKHDHEVCSNTIASFETFIGCKVTGVLRGNGTTTLVFDCGWGLTVKYNGAYWAEEPEKIADAKASLKDELARAGGD